MAETKDAPATLSRREFLKKAGVGAAAIGVAGAARAVSRSRARCGTRAAS